MSNGKNKYPALLFSFGSSHMRHDRSNIFQVFLSVLSFCDFFGKLFRLFVFQIYLSLRLVIALKKLSCRLFLLNLFLNFYITRFDFIIIFQCAHSFCSFHIQKCFFIFKILLLIIYFLFVNFHFTVPKHPCIY